MNVQTDFYLAIGESRQVYQSTNSCWFQLQLAGQQVGCVIGIKGGKINKIRQSGARVILQDDNRLIIMGTHDQVLKAKALVYSALNNGFLTIPAELFDGISCEQLDHIKQTTGVTIEITNGVPNTDVIILATRKNADLRKARKLLIEQSKISIQKKECSDK